MDENPHHAPDRLDDVVAPTGRFRLYIGSVAGVGKTCAMLDEGQRRLERGSDVVIGLVETHGRAKTAEMIRNLEVLPRKVVRYRDREFEEMDLDAVLERKPELVLVDELAHTNVPDAGRHAKRWEDVLEILEHGIAVISTLNVQHIESIADAVESITEVPVRERVPDWVVRRADQIELIDSSPEQLRRRMLHGNIYPQAKINDALSGFFRTSNLTALRELALRFVADETEDDLLEYLRERAPDRVWETTERVLVVVDGSTSDEAVVHRAARIANRLKSSLVVALVSEGERTTSQSERLDGARHTAEQVGASIVDVLAEEYVNSIMKLTSEHQITQLVLAAPGKGFLGGLKRGSPLARLLPAAAEAGLDVHLISVRAPDDD
jgi:two-component system sensor histidine kinase KdpD